MDLSASLPASRSNPDFRVLQVVGDGNPGGATTIVLDLALELVQRRIPVTIASDANSYLLDEAQKHRIPVVQIDFKRRYNTPMIAAALARHLRSYPGTVVHAHGCRAGLPAAILPSSLYRSLVYTVHGFHFRYKKAGIRHLAKLAEWYTIHRAACTIFVSGSDAQTARDHKVITENDTFKIIRNGSRREDIRAGSAAGPQFDIIFLGRLVAVKNVLLLPEILLALRPMRPSLCVIGGGEYEGPLRRRVMEAGLSDQVTFLGPVPHAEAMAYLRRSRVMILPSRWEGMPVSAIEAMHCGVPVVASKVGGTAEVVADGDTGYLVETDDVAGYARCLHRILSDATLRGMLGRRAIARARTEFSIERQLSAHIDLYTEIAAAARSLDVPEINADLTIGKGTGGGY